MIRESSVNRSDKKVAKVKKAYSESELEEVVVCIE